MDYIEITLTQEIANYTYEIAQNFEFMLILTELFEIVI